MGKTKKDANSKKHKSSTKTSKDSKRPKKSSAVAPTPSTSTGKTSNKNVTVKDDHWLQILQMIRDHYKLLVGKINATDDFATREAKWNEILGYCHGLKYMFKDTDHLKKKFNREKRKVMTKARRSKDTGGGGDRALSKMNSCERLIYDMIKENVEHAKKLKSKIPDGGAWQSDSDDSNFSDNHQPDGSPRSGPSRRSSSKGSGVASLNTKLKLISSGGKKTLRNLANSDQESRSGSDGDVPSFDDSESRSSGGSALAIESEGEGHVTRARERSPTPDPPGTYDVELPPLLGRSPSPEVAEQPDDAQAVDVPVNGTPADDPLANVQPLAQPSIEDQIKQQKLEYWQLKVEAKRTKILERRERIKDSKLKRRALRQKFFPMEPDSDDDQFA